MSKQREPLWASSLADEPRTDDEAVFGAPAPAAAPVPVAPARLRGEVVFAVLAVLTAVTAIAAALYGTHRLELARVPSFWGEIPMTCATARIEQEDFAFESFSCRADDGGTLPPGIYRSPASVWTSDLTGAEALAARIVISPDGDLEGRAVY